MTDYDKYRAILIENGSHYKLYFVSHPITGEKGTFRLYESGRFVNHKKVSAIVPIEIMEAILETKRS